MYKYPLITDGQRQELIELDKILEKEPNSIKVLQRKGFILTDCEEFLEAAKVFKKILKIDPKNYDALLWLIIDIARMGDIKQSKEVAEKAVQIYPNDAAFHMYLAESYADLIKYFSYPDGDKLFYHIKRSIKLEPTWIRPRIDLIEYLIEINEFESAKKEIQEAFNHIKDNFPEPKNDVEEYFESLITRRLNADSSRNSLNEFLKEIEDPKNSIKYKLKKL